MATLRVETRAYSVFGSFDAGMLLDNSSVGLFFRFYFPSVPSTLDFSYSLTFPVTLDSSLVFSSLSFLTFCTLLFVPTEYLPAE